MSSPYEIARNIAQAGGKGLEQRMQQDLIGQILKDVGGDPQRANFGINQILANVSPEYQQNPLAQLSNMMTMQQKQQEKQQQNQLKTQEKTAPIMQGLKTVERMREIGKKGRLGVGSGLMGLGGGKTAQDRGEYEQLGKSLISLSTNIPIRNKSEFETLAKKLYNPSLTSGEREGTLKAMERILQGSLAQYGIGQPAVEEEAVVKDRDWETRVI